MAGDYAAWSAIDRIRTRVGYVETRLMRRAFAWRNQTIGSFLAAYWPLAEDAGFLPEPESRKGLLELFRIQKALYELSYEANNRPTWLSIPVRGLLDLIVPREGGA